LISKKEWSEDGALLLVAEMPNSYKEYYENGKLKQEVTGKLVEEDGSFKIKDGIFKEYDQNGNIIDSATFKNFHRISD
jgi:MORN repeat variant.